MDPAALYSRLAANGPPLFFPDPPSPVTFNLDQGIPAEETFPVEDLKRLAGQILDVVFPASAPSRLSGAVSIPGWRVGYIALETEKEPFRRVKARQAVAAALDYGPVLVAINKNVEGLPLI